MIYLDHNATTAPAPEVVSEMLDALQRAWANPSSTHEPGQAARRLLADARTRVARFLGCQGAELVFTSGATEANHQAVLGALALGRAQGRHRLVVSAVEHPGLLALADRLAAEGVLVDRIPVDAQGRLSLDAARRLIGADVALVSVMGANNETGVLMPIAELAEATRAAGALLHVDATQLVGKSHFQFVGSGADLVSVSAHKLHGPKGVGALMVRKGLALPALLSGRQERHRRGGTENIPGIAGFAAACERAGRTLSDDLAHLLALRQALEDGLLRALPGAHLYGDQAPRLPNTSCLRFGVLDSEQVLGKLERAGIVASSGAACAAGSTQPSHVLLAMGESALQAKAGVRFSTGPDTTLAELQQTLAAVQRVLAPLLAEHSSDIPAQALVA
jgi:cysteine desulfurase